MTIQQRIEIIKQLSLFEGITKEEMKMLAEQAKEKTFPPHTIILHPNQTTKGIYIVCKGLLKIYLITSAGKLIPLSIQGPLYIASELNIIDTESEVTMETVQETQVLILQLTDCKKIVMKHTDVLFALLKIVVRKLHVVNRQTEDYYSLSLKERTMDMLRDLTPYFENKIITLSQEDLANLVGATRPRVTEALQEFHNQKLISLQYRQIKIL